MKAILSIMITGAVLGMAIPSGAQSPTVDSSPVSSGAPIPGGRGPGLHPGGVAVVVDPLRVYIPEEAWWRQAVGDTYSRPVFLEESNWRLPRATDVHERTACGRRATNAIGVPLPKNRPVEMLGAPQRE